MVIPPFFFPQFSFLNIIFFEDMEMTVSNLVASSYIMSSSFIWPQLVICWYKRRRLFVPLLSLSGSPAWPRAHYFVFLSSLLSVALTYFPEERCWTFKQKSPVADKWEDWGWWSHTSGIYRVFSALVCNLSLWKSDVWGLLAWSPYIFIVFWWSHPQ